MAGEKKIWMIAVRMDDEDYHTVGQLARKYNWSEPEVMRQALREYAAAREGGQENGQR